jgi:hypothetical protein
MKGIKVILVVSFFVIIALVAGFFVGRTTVQVSKVYDWETKTLENPTPNLLLENGKMLPIDGAPVVSP